MMHMVALLVALLAFVSVGSAQAASLIPSGWDSAGVGYSVLEQDRSSEFQVTGIFFENGSVIVPNDPTFSIGVGGRIELMGELFSEINGNEWSVGFRNLVDDTKISFVTDAAFDLRFGFFASFVVPSTPGGGVTHMGLSASNGLVVEHFQSLLLGDGTAAPVGALTPYSPGDRITLFATFDVHLDFERSRTDRWLTTSPCGVDQVGVPSGCSATFQLTRFVPEPQVSPLLAFALFLALPRLRRSH